MLTRLIKEGSFHERKYGDLLKGLKTRLQRRQMAILIDNQMKYLHTHRKKK